MVSEKEMEIVLLLFKDFTARYNARSISAKVGMTPRGALKALKSLERQGFVTARPFGRAIEYRLNFASPVARKIVELFLLEEAELQHKRWVAEFRDFDARILLLFGSVLRKEKGYNDVDVVIVVDKNRLAVVEAKVREKNEFMAKRIHPVWQSPEDLKRNLKKLDEVILDAVRTGVAIKGGNELVEVVSNVASS